MNCLWQLLIVFVITSSGTDAQDKCIYAKECPFALKHLALRRNDAKSRDILASAYCGSNGTEAKVICEQIPDLSMSPTDCIHIDDCPAALELIKTKREDPATSAMLRAAHCGYKGRQALVQCGQIKPNERRAATRLGTDNKMDLLPTLGQCGLNGLQPKIFGGKIADLDDFPWLALIQFKLGDVTRFGCHGSLISKKYVITAAHCIDLTDQGKKDLGVIYQVVLGEYDTRNKTDCVYLPHGVDCADPVKTIEIESSKAHPQFGLSVGFNDIGLLRLKEEVTFTAFIKPICLPQLPFSLQDDENLLISGWGKTETSKMSHIKLKARIQYLNRDKCYERLARYFTDGQICAGSDDGSDSCKGDSGGPLMVERLASDLDFHTFLIGVVSYGPRCGYGAAVYTNIPAYMPWIMETIEE